MFDAQIESLNQRIRKVILYSDGKPVSYAAVVDHWKDSERKDSEMFRSFFTSLLADAPFQAYFWETPPVTTTNLHQTFEFVWVDSPSLAARQADSHAFDEYFKSAKQDEQVITFPNLGQDAVLVVPCPLAPSSVYAHLSTFVRNAPNAQTHELWQRVGEMIEKEVSDRPLWLSTSGLGVSWLHVRLDSVPKYYTYHPYKTFA
jgi:hypothetical protein